MRAGLVLAPVRMDSGISGASLVDRLALLHRMDRALLLGVARARMVRVAMAPVKWSNSGFGVWRAGNVIGTGAAKRNFAYEAQTPASSAQQHRAESIAVAFVATALFLPWLLLSGSSIRMFMRDWR